MSESPAPTVEPAEPGFALPPSYAGEFVAVTLLLPLLLGIVASVAPALAVPVVVLRDLALAALLAQGLVRSGRLTHLASTLAPLVLIALYALLVQFNLAEVRRAAMPILWSGVGVLLLEEPALAAGAPPLRRIPGLEAALLAVAIASIALYLVPTEWISGAPIIGDYYHLTATSDPYYEPTITTLNGKFYSWDFAWWAGGPVRRAIGPSLEPTTTAAALAFGCTVTRRRALRALLMIAGLLTLSKGFVLFVLAYLLFGLPRRLAAVLIAGGTAVVLGVTAWVAENAPGLLNHVLGLASSGDNFSLLGRGFTGDTGFVSGEMNLEVGAESAVGTAIYWFGAPALLYLAALVLPILKVLRFRPPGDEPGPDLRAIKALGVFLLVSLVLSESYFAFYGFGACISLVSAHAFWLERDAIPAT